MNENGTTRRIWNDPVIHLIITAGATVASTVLIIQHVTVPYYYVVAEQWSRVSAPIITAIFGSPGSIIELLMADPTTVGIFGTVPAVLVALMLRNIPILVVAGAPLVASYLFWIKLVYCRVLGGGGR